MIDGPLDGLNENGITIQPAAVYATLYPHLREVARGLGYALAVHGSLRNDLDLVAVPWVEDAAPAEVLVEALRALLGGTILEPAPSAKPHGRRAYTITLYGAGGYIDLSVMPLG